MQRAQRTCELAGLGDRAVVHPLLQEWDYGDVEGRTTAQLRDQQPGWSVWVDGCPNGENAAAIDRRCAQLLVGILHQADRAGPVDPRSSSGPVPASPSSVRPGSPPQAPRRLALFSHGQFLRALAAHWLGLGAASGRLLSLSTATWSVLGHEREQRTIVRWNAPSVLPPV
jgi:probable phosphoglycerate mutase